MSTYRRWGDGRPAVFADRRSRAMGMSELPGTKPFKEKVMKLFTILSLAVTVVAAVYDVRKKELPRFVFFAACLISAIFIAKSAFLGGSWFIAPLLSLIPGAALVALAFLSKEAMGYGDGLYAMSVGPVFGMEIMFMGIFAAFFLCGITSVLLLVLKRADRKSSLPYIPFLLVGMGVAGYVFA